MAALVFLIIAVAVSTIFGSSSSGAGVVKEKANARLTANNDVPNPDIKLDCEKPVLTMALVLDRSGSVWQDSDGAAPAIYKDSVKQFLSQLSGELLSRDGEINVLLYAFGSRTIVQNKATASNELITKIDSTTSLNEMNDAVDRIFFSPYANGSDDSAMNASGSAYDQRRGYNAGVPTTGNYSMTNWDDALQGVAKIGEAAYSNPAAGKHIDLTLMLTDGMPNVNNGSNRTFEPSDLSSYNSSQGRIYSADTVRELRLGTTSRPPMAVRGVLINSSSTSAMDEVFGPGTYSTADNFEDDLQSVLDQIIHEIDTDEICEIDYVKPQLDVTPPVSSWVVEEGPGGAKTITFTIKNNLTITNKDGSPTTCPPSACDITNIEVSYPGFSGSMPIPRLAPGATTTRTITIDIPLGGTYPSPANFKVTGKFAETKKLKLAPGFTLPTYPGGGPGQYQVSDSATYKVAIDRLALPA